MSSATLSLQTVPAPRVPDRDQHPVLDHDVWLFVSAVDGDVPVSGAEARACLPS